jgi:translocation and assembly module TamA
MQRIRIVPLLAILASPCGHGWAADPLPYRFTLADTGDAALNAALAGIATLESLRDSLPVGPLALIARARADAARFATALQSAGHYAGRVTMRIADMDIDSPDLADRLDAMPADPPVPVTASIIPGPVFTLRHIVLHGGLPDDAAALLGLAEGAPARAGDVIAAADRLRDALRARGHALARIDPPEADPVPGATAIDVHITGEAGPRVDLGTISITGLSTLRESAIRARLGLAESTPFDPRVLDRARADVAGFAPVASVRLVEAEALDAQGRLPLRVEIAERKPRVIRVEAGWSTDQGGNLGTSWTHRNLRGGGEQLSLNAGLIELGGSAERAPGYTLGAALTLPDWLRHDQSLELRANAAREYLRAYNRTGVTIAALVPRKLSDTTTLTAGLSTTEAAIMQEGVSRDYFLVQNPLQAAYDTTTDKLDPAHGLRATLDLTPSFGPGASFLIAQGTASTYLDLGALPGRSILALRALVGLVEGAATADIPPDQRFYAGGSASIRGYRYQSVGKLFASGRPTGGTSVDAATIELRQRIGESWGAVVFADAGQLGQDGAPFAGALRVGAGIGARYYSGIGPLRLDIAVPLSGQRKTDSVQIYAGIGHAF